MNKIFIIITLILLSTNNVLARYGAVMNKADGNFIVLTISIIIISILYLFLIKITNDIGEPRWKETDYIIKYSVFQLIFGIIIFYILKGNCSIDIACKGINNIGYILQFILISFIGTIIILLNIEGFNNLKELFNRSLIAISTHFILLYIIIIPILT